MGARPGSVLAWKRCIGSDDLPTRNPEHVCWAKVNPVSTKDKNVETWMTAGLPRTPAVFVAHVVVVGDWCHCFHVAHVAYVGCFVIILLLLSLFLVHLQTRSKQTFSDSSLLPLLFHGLSA